MTITREQASTILEDLIDHHHLQFNDTVEWLPTAPDALIEALKVLPIESGMSEPNAHMASAPHGRELLVFDELSGEWQIAIFKESWASDARGYVKDWWDARRSIESFVRVKPTAWMDTPQKTPKA